MPPWTRNIRRARDRPRRGPPGPQSQLGRRPVRRALRYQGRLRPSGPRSRRAPMRRSWCARRAVTKRAADVSAAAGAARTRKTRVQGPETGWRAVARAYGRLLRSRAPCDQARSIRRCRPADPALVALTGPRRETFDPWGASSRFSLLISPRLVLFLLWIFSSVLSRAFDSWIVPLLGFFLLPWTTLAYVAFWEWGSGHHVIGFEWFFVVLAFLIDVGSYAHGRQTQSARTAE